MADERRFGGKVQMLIKSVFYIAILFSVGCSGKPASISWSFGQSKDFLVTAQTGLQSKLLRVSDESGKPELRQIASFPSKFVTILASLKSEQSYLGTIRVEELNSDFLVWLKYGQLKKVLAQVGTRTDRLAYLPETSQLLQLQVPYAGCGCSDCNNYSYYINLYKVSGEDDNDVEVQQVAHFPLPSYPARCEPTFKTSKNNTIFGVLESVAEIPIFVGEAVGDEIKELSPVSSFEGFENSKFGFADFDFVQGQDLVAITRILDHTSPLPHRVEIFTWNWKSGEVIGSIYEDTFANTVLLPVACVDRNTLAVATGEQFILLRRASEREDWKKVKSVPISFSAPTYALEIRLIGKNTAVVLNRTNYQVVEF